MALVYKIIFVLVGTLIFIAHRGTPAEERQKEQDTEETEE